MNILAFAASSSKKSINKQLLSYIAKDLLPDQSTEILDLNDYEMPLFSVDKEEELGHPELAKEFLSKIAHSDAIIISFAEHNGSYSAAYKNLFDWCSRINPKVFQKKPIILLSASPGPRGGATVLEAAVKSAPFFDGDVKGSLSIAKFYDQFDVQCCTLLNKDIKADLVSTLAALK